MSSVAAQRAGVHVVAGVPQTQFARVEYTIATSDAERIGLNTAAEVTSGAVGDNAALAQHYKGVHGGLSMLADRIKLLLTYLDEMRVGTVPVNHQVCTHSPSPSLTQPPALPHWCVVCQ